MDDLTAERYPPLLRPRLRPHRYTPDLTNGTTWRRERPCARCNLPKRNAVHVDEPVDEDRQRGAADA